MKIRLWNFRLQLQKQFIHSICTCFEFQILTFIDFISIQATTIYNTNHSHCIYTRPLYQNTHILITLFHTAIIVTHLSTIQKWTKNVHVCILRNHKFLTLSITTPGNLKKCKSAQYFRGFLTKAKLLTSNPLDSNREKINENNQQNFSGYSRLKVLVVTGKKCWLFHMAIGVVEFSREGYKIRKVFA